MSVAVYARSLWTRRPDCNAKGGEHCGKRGGGQGALRDSDLSRVLAERIMAINDARPAEPWNAEDRLWVMEFAGA